MCSDSNNTMSMRTSNSVGLDEFISFGLKTCPPEDCRICLENVGVRPIFGDANKPDISMEIITFGGIQLRKDDDFPHYICEQCFSLLENAMSFRHCARRTDALLKRRKKKLTQPTIPKVGAVSNHITNESENKLDKSKIEYVSMQVPSVTDISDMSYLKNETAFHEPHLTHPNDPHNTNSFQQSFVQQIHHGNNNMVMFLVNDNSQLTTLNPPISSSSHSMASATSSNSYANANSHISSMESHPNNIYNPDNTYNSAPTSHHNQIGISNENNDDSRDSPIPFENRVELENKEESSNYYCKYCKANFVSQEEYEEHRNTIQHKRNYVISFLPKKTTKKSNDGSDSTDDKSSNRAKDQKCSICDELFTKLQFPKHMQVEHNITIENPSKRECKICKKLIDRRSLPRHIKRKHENDKDKEPKVKLECPICKKVFAKQYFPLHMNRHKESENKKYVCEQCGRKFAFKSSFNTHRLVHTNEFPHKCSYCPYQGRTKGLLKIHMRTHTGDYPFKCTQCDTQCLTKSNLNWHMKRHKGPVDYVCGACSRGFYSKLQLDRHIAVTHYGQKNHICQFCGSAFGYRNGLMRHLRKVHKRPKVRGASKGSGMAEITRIAPDKIQEQKPLEPPVMPHPPTASYIVQNFVY